MNLARALVLIVFVLLATALLGQDRRITDVENNLIEPKELIFEDSILPKYNIRERMERYKIPSVTVALIDNGKIQWSKSYGYADVEGKKKADPGTLYQVASISKSVNSVGILKLVQRGKLSLTTDIRSYLKTWIFPDNAFSKGKVIALKNLLSHTAGLNVHGFVGYSMDDTIPTTDQILNGVPPANNEAIRPVHPPGTRFEYSGGGSIVLRKILDDHISAYYDSLMQALVLGPLKMTSSTFAQPLSAKHKNYAYGYGQDNAVLKGKYYIYPEQSAGGLWSTATDIAKFVLGIQDALRGSKSALLNKGLTEEMLTPVLNNYALGFGVVEKGGEQYFWHEGQSYGYTSMYYGSFTTGKGVVILTNAYPNNGQPFIQELLHSVADVYKWSGFYNPVRKELVHVPQTLLDKYVGDYYTEDNKMKITIRRAGDGLELTARRPEKMYATGEGTFLLASSPNDNCVFSSAKKNGFIDTFEVLKDGSTIVKAVKRP